MAMTPTQTAALTVIVPARQAIITDKDAIPVRPWLSFFQSLLTGIQYPQMPVYLTAHLPAPTGPLTGMLAYVSDNLPGVYVCTGTAWVPVTALAALTGTEIAALTGPQAGWVVMNTTTHHPNYYNGAAWVAL